MAFLVCLSGKVTTARVFCFLTFRDFHRTQNGIFYSCAWPIFLFYFEKNGFSCLLPTSDPISSVGMLKYDWLKIGEMYICLLKAFAELVLSRTIAKGSQLFILLN